MRAKHLIEAEHDFGAHAGEVLDKVTKLAGGAYNKFKSEYQKSKSEVEAAAAKAEKEAAKQGKAPVEDITTKAANLIVSKIATREDVEALGLDASELQDLYAKIQEFEVHLSKFPAALKKAILTSGMLSDDQKHDLDDRLANHEDPNLVQRASVQIDLDKNGEQDRWHQALVNKDLTEVSNAFVRALQKINTENEKYNAGVHTQIFRTGAKPKLRPSGTKLIDILTLQRQAIAERINDVKSIITDIESHPQAAPVAESIQRLAAKAKRRL